MWGYAMDSRIVMFPTSGTAATPFYIGRGNAHDFLSHSFYMSLPNLLQRLVEAAHNGRDLEISGTQGLPANRLRLELWVSRDVAFRHRRKLINVTSSDTVQAITRSIKTWYDRHRDDVKEGAYADWIAGGFDPKLKPQIQDRGNEGYAIDFTPSKLSVWFVALSAGLIATCATALAITIANFICNDSPDERGI
jgi:hypothetical protein